jgi:hypothetical protein
MPTDFISLTCQSCGAKLDVYPDMERFACRNCGAEMIVQRRGGTVGLKSITKAIRGIQIGTDKTAAELALLRLQNEVAILRQEHAKAMDNLRSLGSGYGFGWFDKLFIVLLGKPAEAPRLRVRQLETRIAEVERQILIKRRITEG